MSALVCVSMPGCVCGNRGFSQRAELQVIIMYRLVCCDANANVLSVAAVRGLTLRLLGCFSAPINDRGMPVWGGGDRPGLSGAQP